MPTTARQRPLPLALTLLCSALPALAFEPPPDASNPHKAFPGESYSPFAASAFPSRSLWGDTVDVEKTTFANTIGSPELPAVWTDTGFDAAQRAFHYARVIEIPTPRWSAYDAFRFGIELPEGAPTETQERAYTSPIWYTPDNSTEGA